MRPPLTVPEPATIPELLRIQRARGGHPLLICDSDRISYGDAERRSAQLSKGLIALGAGKGTHVGLWYPNGTDFLIGMLAAARIGAVVVPFSTFMTAGEVRTQLVGSDVAVLLSARGYRSHDYVQRLGEALETEVEGAAAVFTEYAPVLRHIVFASTSLERLGGAVSDQFLAAVEDDVDGPDPLAVIYTSGSTGAPKGAVHTHAALIGHQRNLNRIRGLDAQDKLFCNSPFFWIGGFAFGAVATVVAGATLVCSNATDAAVTLDLLEAEQPTVTNGFVAGIEHLTRHPSFGQRDLSSMRRGNLYPIMAPDARPHDAGLRHNMLGMTEAGSVVLLSEDHSDQPESRRGSYVRPAPGFEAKVIDPDTGLQVPVGETGEFCIRGPYVMQGYYGRSREECFDVDGWFHTGDLVHTDADGFFYFVARSGAMIKTAGANVTPGEVEQALRAVLPELGQTASVHVLGLPDATRGQMVAAVLVSDDPIAGLDETELRRRLAAHLSAYKVPRVFTTCLRADLPVLSSGKVDLSALAELFDA
jgi:acyl-CoA synthetase (AMP-forming)/AMP-acid ligase II